MDRFASVIDFAGGFGSRVDPTNIVLSTLPVVESEPFSVDGDSALVREAKLDCLIVHYPALHRLLERRGPAITEVVTDSVSD